jgi:hypothetical protein
MGCVGLIGFISSIGFIGSIGSIGSGDTDVRKKGWEQSVAY